VYVRNQRLKASQSNRTGSNLGDVGRDSSARCLLCAGGDSFGRSFLAGPEAAPNVCGVGVAMLQGHSWAPNPLTGSW
jgi:hypothetical protein